MYVPNNARTLQFEIYDPRCIATCRLLGCGSQFLYRDLFLTWLLTVDSIL